MIKNTALIFLLLFSVSTIASFAQERNSLEGIPEEYKPYIYADPADVEWFEDARFGVFIHWGPSSLAKVPISWGRYGPRPGAGRQATGGVPQEEYDKLYKIFNPIDFNADEWVSMMKKSGARYFIFTTKHHDGFCMFDAHNTDYKITNTPFGRDVAKELADACHKHGIKLFWYYSQPDWHHPDCLTERNDRYREYMYEHLHQLLTEYGKVDGLFFDHLGTKSADWDTPRMLKMIRTLQPGILVNKRWGNGMPGVDDRGDYDTPEQEIGHFQIERPWETCATMATAWSWTGGERIKSYETNLRILIQCAGAGGNLALNTGPKPDGSINPTEKENYLRIGKWLERNGESIFGTMGGPYKPGPWGVSTRKGNKIYIHFLCDFAGGLPMEIQLPDLPGKVNSASIMNSGEAVDFIQKNGLLGISLAQETFREPDIIVELEYNGNAEEITPIETLPEGSRIRPVAWTASSSSGEKNSPEVVFAKAEERFAEGISHKGWWAPGNGDTDPWLSVELEKATVIQYIKLKEQIRNCVVRKFVIEYEKDDNWIELHTGDQIGMDYSVKVPPIECSKLRIRILETAEDDTPNISSIEIFEPGPESQFPKIKVHGLFTNNMVIQRETLAPIWGTADPGAQISIDASWGSQVSTTADAKGNWLARIETPQAGGPHTIKIAGIDTIQINNVLSGDVWVCGGQSNMDFPLISFVRSDRVPEDIAKKYASVITGQYPEIRTILLDKQYRAEPQKDIVVTGSFNNSWQLNSDSLINGQTTAVGFFFGRSLNEHLGVPIGLIDANKGGTNIKLWTSSEAMGIDKIPEEIDGVAKGSSVLYNGMIAPLMPFAIKGVIWYQGEANSKSLESAMSYSEDFKTMIEDWRNHWGQGDFPFLFVQLAAFHSAIEEPSSEKHFWPFTRESQSNALELPNTGMASAIDLGMQKNIHPWMKEEVGERLALSARKVAYAEDLVYTGPTYKKMKIKGNKAIIQFDHAGSGLVSKTMNLDGIQLNENELRGFIICGTDGVFHLAHAKIKGKTVVVSCPEVKEPTAVRYGWADFPICNLYNKEGLPVNPFRSDK